MLYLHVGFQGLVLKHTDAVLLLLLVVVVLVAVAVEVMVSISVLLQVVIKIICPLCGN
jgi:hypothetical protein